MKSVLIKTPREQIDSKSLDFCCEQLQRGELIVLPTDTVYGVGCHAFKQKSIQEIYSLKGRSYKKPLPLLLAHESQLALVVSEVIPEARRLMKKFWPGPLTLVFKTGPLAFHATRGKDTVAVRIPDHGVVKQILEKLDFPLATTSANPSGEPSNRSFGPVKKTFHNKVAMLLDGGTCPVSIESTVVDVTHYPFTILRVGALSKKEIENALLAS